MVYKTYKPSVTIYMFCLTLIIYRPIKKHIFLNIFSLKNVKHI